MWSFYKTLFKDPRTVGSIFPSSPFLARAIAAFIAKNTRGFIVELGPGTGVVTKQILKCGIPAKQMVLIEHSTSLAKALSNKFPEIETIHGNATHLVDLLGERKSEVAVIVSSLPFLTLPEETTQKIIDQIEKTLKPGGYYIQYTYGTRHSRFDEKKTFVKIASRRVWLNLPPARVDVFKAIAR